MRSLEEAVSQEMGRLSARYPISAIYDELFRYSDEAMICLAAIERPHGKPLENVSLLLDQAYMIGLLALHVRARALREAPTSYSARYKALSLDHGLSFLDASLRRRAMYFPALGDEATLCAIVAERMDSQSRFSLRAVGEAIKAHRTLCESIDWLPFGGRP